MNIGGVIERGASEKIRAERESLRASGLGFWRLVWIVALGILLAQAIAGVAFAVFRFLAG